VVLLLLLLIGAGAAVFLVLRHRAGIDRQRNDARAYLQGWTAANPVQMWNALDAESRRRYPLARFRTLVESANRAAGVKQLTTGRPTEPRDGVVTVTATATTELYGTLSGTLRLDVGAKAGGVAWRPDLRLPSLRRGEAVKRVVLSQSRRGSVLDRNGGLLTARSALAAFVPGLQAQYAQRLRGRPGSELRFGTRSIGRVSARSGHSVHSTLRPGLQQVAQEALGSKLGGVAVIDPRDGSALALAGIAVSAPQPPGSTFKIITLAGASSSPTRATNPAAAP
jgi:peptidoglycan glycosyltransferase